MVDFAKSRIASEVSILVLVDVGLRLRLELRLDR